MHKAVVITSIYPASPSIRKWTTFTDWKVVVAGDKKTPEDWSCHPAVSCRFSIETNLINAYESLIRYDLIPKCELDLVLAWVQDIQNMPGKQP